MALELERASRYVRRVPKAASEHQCATRDCHGTTWDRWCDDCIDLQAGDHATAEDVERELKTSAVLQK